MALPNYHLPIRPILNSAWDKIAGSKKAFCAAALIAVLIILPLLWLEDTEDYFSFKTYFALSVFSSFMNFLLIAGVTLLGIRRAFDLPISYLILLQVFKPSMALNIIGLYILKTVINFGLAFLSVLFPFGILSVLIGLSAIIFIQVRLILSLGFVLEKEVNPWVAMKLSFKATRFQFWRLFLLVFIQISLYMFSLLTLGIAFIWMIPYTIIMYGIVYKNLSEQLEKNGSGVQYKSAKSLLVDFL